MRTPYARFRIDSIEVYADLLSGYDAEVRQVQAGALDLSHEVIDLGDVRILRWSTNRRLSSHLAHEPGWTIVGAAQRSGVPPLWCNGVELGGDDLVIATQADESHTIELPGLAVIDVMIHDDVVRSSGLLANGAGSAADRPDEGRRAMPPLAAAAYRTRVNALVDQVAGDPTGASGWVLDGVLDAVVDALEASEGPDGLARRAPRAADEWVGRAVEVIRAEDPAEMRLIDLASRVGTTPRTLQRSFRAVLGISPYQYLLRHRLNDARRLLRHGDVTVTEVAHRFGFTSSQFGVHHRRVFRHPPSTLLGASTDSGLVRSGPATRA